MEKQTHKSQLAKDLAQSLFICQLRDDLADLLDDAVVQDARNNLFGTINACYVKATVLLACSIVNSKQIQGAHGRCGNDH